MRSFLIATALAVICSCASTNTDTDTGTTATIVRAPRLYFDLRYPIYMVIDQSFWSGCEKDPAGDKACRALRLKNIHAGVNQWLDYFDKTARPLVPIFSLGEQPPANRVNKIVRIRLLPDYCGKEALACWSEWANPPNIVFVHSQWITPRIMAHEFGHVLGRGDNDVPKGTSSIMSYDNQKVVEPLDIKMMCALHRECRMGKK